MYVCTSSHSGDVKFAINKLEFLIVVIYGIVNILVRTEQSRKINSDLVRHFRLITPKKKKLP